MGLAGLEVTMYTWPAKVVEIHLLLPPSWWDWRCVPSRLTIYLFFKIECLLVIFLTISLLNNVSWSYLPQHFPSHFPQMSPICLSSLYILSFFINSSHPIGAVCCSVDCSCWLNLVWASMASVSLWEQWPCHAPRAALKALLLIQWLWLSFHPLFHDAAWVLAVAGVGWGMI